MALQASSASVSVSKGEPPTLMARLLGWIGRHEAGASVKAGTAAALITDHERKAVSIRVPYFHLLDATDDADELHGRSTPGPSPLDKPPSQSEGIS